MVDKIRIRVMQFMIYVIVGMFIFIPMTVLVCMTLASYIFCIPAVLIVAVYHGIEHMIRLCKERLNKEGKNE